MQAQFARTPAGQQLFLSIMNCCGAVAVIDDGEGFWAVLVTGAGATLIA
jgi:hypothetical protein